MRLAYIIITHKNPIQLERLIKKMQHPNFDFYIHVDGKVDIQDFLYLKGLNGVNFIQNRVICNWGGYSTLKAMTSSLKEVLENGIGYSFYSLLSAQDYPIKTNTEIYDFFSKNPNKSFIFYEDKSDWWDSAVQRFQKYHLTDFNFTGKSLIESTINKILPKRKFPLPLVLFGGSKASWWTLNHESATYLTNFLTREKARLDKFLKFCWGTDEFVIPTILKNSHLKDKIVNNNLRYIDFPSGKANPKILEFEDLQNIINSDMLFARKFDLKVSSELLDKIDEYTQEV